MPAICKNISFITLVVSAASLFTSVVAQNASASIEMNTIPYHYNLHPEMVGTLLQVIITLSTALSSNITLQDAPMTVPNSNTNGTIRNVQHPIAALQQTIGSLQQALLGLQHSASPQNGNLTVSTGDNSTVASSIQEEQQQNQKVSIIPGSATLTYDGGFQPDPIQVQVGDTVTWTNDDLESHTVTSGSNGVSDNKFNSSPNFIPLMASGTTFSHTFTEPGKYPYFCLLHPNMVGTVIVIS
jgi:plastocyanin